MHKCVHFGNFVCTYLAVWISGESSLNHSTGKNKHISTTALTNQYTQIDGVCPKITHFKHMLGCTFFKIPITHTQSMFLLCKLFSTAIHSISYCHHVMRLYADEWKLTFLCPNRLGHYIICFHSTLKSFVTSQLLYIL